MAAPLEVDIRNLGGQWKWNSGLSDDPKPAMTLQGIGALIRLTLANAPITLRVTQDADPTTGEAHMTTVQSSLGRVVEEQRVFDWSEMAQSHLLYGQLKTKARFAAPADIADATLSEGWEPGLAEIIEVLTEGSDWTSWQAWGFEMIDGSRFHVRRAVVQRAEQRETVRMVYSWDGHL